MTTIEPLAALVSLMLVMPAFAMRGISLTADQWHQDLQYLASQLREHHRNPYHYTAKAEFEKAVAALDRQIPFMKDYEVLVALESLAAGVGDGHTFLATAEHFHKFPLEVFWFGDQLRVTGAARDYRQALGAKIIQIGSLPIREVKVRLQQLIPQGENEWYVLNHSAELITQAEPLAALHVVPDVGPAEFTFEDDSSHSFRMTIPPQVMVDRASFVTPYQQPPLFLSHTEDPFWFTYLAEAQTVYVNFRSYDGLEEKAKRLWDLIGQHTVKRLIIDMRSNGGGNYIKGREYLISKITFLSQVNRSGHLFVITGRKTFSAAMTNVTDFRRETEAILVGEPTGARPNGYQENLWFTLPWSQVKASCATLHYRFQPEKDTPAVFPDKRIDPEWELYREGKDPALLWILTQ